MAPRPLAPKLEKEDDRGGHVGVVPSAEPQATAHGHHHQPHLMHVPGMQAQSRPAAPQARWAPPSVNAAHWDYAASACGMLSQQQPPGGPSPAMPMQSLSVAAASATFPSHQSGPHGQAPSQQMQPPMPPAPAPSSAQALPVNSAATTAGTGGPPHQPASSNGPAPGSQMSAHHPAAAAMRGYTYGPYGEPCPYPPHARPAPGPYHHPGMPGPHGHMLGYHPGFPPVHHLPQRGAFYPHDGRFPPMGPCHPGYPPPGYYRGHPGMPPSHPHPAYHYMPPPYGGHHPSMHPGMYHTAPGPGGQQPLEVHPRDGTASATSAGTAVCGGAGSDGGSDPASAARHVAKINGSSGGSESEDVGLEAVITLRPGLPEQDEAVANADGSDGAMAPDPTDATGRPIAVSTAAVGPGGQLLPDSSAAGMHMHKMAPWPHMALPPSHGGPPPNVGNYEWQPPPPAMMQGYSQQHASGNWGYQYDPLAAVMHQQHLLLSGELQDEDPGGLDMHQVPRRRPSQSSLGGQLNVFPQQPLHPASRRPPFQMPQQSGFPMPYSAKAPGSMEQHQQQQQRSYSTEQGHGVGPSAPTMQRSGSFGQLFSGAGDGQCYVSRRTQRLKKRRSADLAPQQPGSTPDPFALAVVAAERAAMGRDSSTGSGAAAGLPPMFPGSGGPRRSSNGSDRTALQGRALMPSNNRQRSDPGYLIEGTDQGGGWGAGVMVGPAAGLGQLVHYPQQQLQQQAMQQQAMQQPVLRRTSENGSGGRAINLPKRFEDAIMTLEYPKAPQPNFAAVRKANGAPFQMQQGMPYDLLGHGDPVFEEPYYDEEEDEEDGQDLDLADAVDDSDEDYEAGLDRRGFRSGRMAIGAGAVAVEGPSRKRKAPMSREDPPQPEKKRKARDPATISKVVINCVIILRMVNQELVYEKEIRTALGNNPDTSKALRLLMNQGKLVRTGQGGRGNPFCYRCTPLGIATLQRVEETATPGADPSTGPNQEQRAAAVAV